MNKAKNKSLIPFNSLEKPLLIVISGSSGVGKDTVLSCLKKTGYPLEHITTVTTRPQRANEENDIDYHFTSVKKFQKMIEQKELLEWAKVYGNWYGVPRQPIKQALDKRKDVIIKVDVQGAATIKGVIPQAVFIFLLPPSMGDLATRLQKRYTESTTDLALRLKTAEEELKQLHLFDYAVVNWQDKIDLAVSDIKAIITAEKHRLTPREINL